MNRIPAYLGSCFVRADTPPNERVSTLLIGLVPSPGLNFLRLDVTGTTRASSCTTKTKSAANETVFGQSRTVERQAAIRMRGRSVKNLPTPGSKLRRMGSPLYHVRQTMHHSYHVLSRYESGSVRQQQRPVVNFCQRLDGTACASVRGEGKGW